MLLRVNNKHSMQQIPIISNNVINKSLPPTNNNININDINSTIIMTLKIIIMNQFNSTRMTLKLKKIIMSYNINNNTSNQLINVSNKNITKFIPKLLTLNNNQFKTHMNYYNNRCCNKMNELIYIHFLLITILFINFFICLSLFLLLFIFMLL